MKNRFKQHRQEWEHRLTAWKSTGQSGAAWCRQEQISYKTFCNWKFRLLRKPLLKDSFLELQEEKTTGIELTYHGVQIHLDQNFDPLLLKKCLQALRNLAC